MPRFKVPECTIRKLGDDFALFLANYGGGVPNSRALELTDRDLWSLWHTIHGHYVWGDDNPNLVLWCGRRLVEPDPTIPLYLHDSNDATMTTALRRAASYCAHL